MKSYHPISLIFVIILLSCNEATKPLPELTYSGEEPRVQNPLSPEDSQQHIQVPDGFETVLFAAEPNIINPIAFAWDERGRLWVVQSMDYPHGLDNEVGGDRITICEDTNGDGKADQFTDFATEQSLITGITIVKGGAIVAQAPDMVFLEDTNGDDKADKREVLFSGFGGWDTHAGPSNLRWGVDNMLWGAVGYSGFESKFGDQTINFSMGVYRFSRDGSYFEPVGKFNNNTWGVGFNENFEIFGSTANNNHVCYVGLPLKHYSYLEKRPSWAINSDFIQGHYEITSVTDIPLQQVDVRGGYTAAAGANFYTATNYPSEYRNQMYVNEPTGHLVHLARIERNGAGYKEVDGGNIFASTDAWTSPVYSDTGPDGNLWVADWYNPVIQHNPDARGMDNQIWNDERGEGNAHLNPLRDKRHGRIYIIRHEDGEDSEISSLDSGDPDGLMKALESTNMFWRTTAQRLIVENQSDGLSPELIRFAGEKIDNKSAVHALWALDGLGQLNQGSAAYELVEKALDSEDEAVRRAGLGLIDESAEGTALLLSSGLLEDDHLPTRLAALLRATELPETREMYEKMVSLKSDHVNKSDKWLRAALKIYFREPNAEDIKAEEVEMIIPSAQEESTKWRYTFSNPGEGWETEGFDDEEWEEGASSFGTKDFTGESSTVWSGGDIWLRKDVILDNSIENPVLKVFHDEKYEVYVNGKLLYSDNGYVTSYKYIRLDPETNNLFKKGKNTIAVNCHNENGAQHIDIGIGKVGEFKADRTIRVETVPQKMAYDKTTLYATAGQNIEIILNNVDQMPHNMVVIEAGSLANFGELVDEFLKNPEAAEMEYVPKSRYVLAYSEMLDPGEVGVIRFKAPDKPGEYPFVCTFPGHWRIMQGVLVVAAPGNYISENPNAEQLVMMGGGSSHDFKRFFAGDDGQLLSQKGKFTIRYTENSVELNALLEKADVLMISNNKPFDVSTRQQIFSRVEEGMAMMINHPSTWYNWTDWPEYNKSLVGGGSKSHEALQEFEVRVVKPNHPIMKGVPSKFRVTDELYRWEKDHSATEIEVLAVGRGLESGEEYPVVWVVKHPKSRIVGNTLGHDQDSHSHPAYKQILLNTFNELRK